MEIEDIISKAKDRGFQEIIFYLNIKKAKPLFTSYECEINNEFACMLDSGAAIVQSNTIIKSTNKYFHKKLLLTLSKIGIATLYASCPNLAAPAFNSLLRVSITC